MTEDDKDLQVGRLMRDRKRTEEALSQQRERAKTIKDRLEAVISGRISTT